MAGVSGSLRTGCVFAGRRGASLASTQQPDKAHGHRNGVATLSQCRAIVSIALRLGNNWENYRLTDVAGNAVQTEVLSAAKFSMSLLPLARGRRWPTGRMRGMTWSEYIEPGNRCLFPLTLALSPVENVSSWKINCGGRGDNRKKIHRIISDRVKYSSATPSNPPQ